MILTLIGHRGCGKTTLGEWVAAKLGLNLVDLDQSIERETGRSPESWIEESENQFRQLELECIAKVPDGSLVTPGAGIERIPPSHFTVWIRRDGWEEVAKNERARLRTDLSWEKELAWMIETREPRYQHMADIKLEIPAHEEPKISASRLSAQLEMILGSRRSDLFKKSWWIGLPHRLEQSASQVTNLGGAGIEVRNDLFPKTPAKAREVPVLFSVRRKGARDLPEGTERIDIDLTFQNATFEPSIPKVYSSHPEKWEMPEFPSEAQDVKWAPRPSCFYDLRHYFPKALELRAGFPHVTILPQGQRWQWLRILEAVRANRWNYISSELEDHASGAPSLQTWSLYAHASPNPKLYGLIGEPVHQSAGPLFHNYHFAKNTIDAIYVPIPVPSDELEMALEILAELGFSGLSVTAPHKRGLFDCSQVEPDERARRLKSANTLSLDQSGRWQAQTTDPEGMTALLQEIDPKLSGKVLLLGTGGVSSAVQEALKGLNRFEVDLIGYRELDRVEWNSPMAMVINATGKGIEVPDGFSVPAWIDLRYGMRARNGGGRSFLSGERFFEVQAQSQLRIWGLTRGED